ncbi:hypothetical protein [Spirosoma litoris]
MSNLLPNSLDLSGEFLADPKLARTLSGTTGDVADDPEVRQLHYNRPQLKVMMVGANDTRCVWGRGTGKTEGVIAPHLKRCVDAMPRSHGTIVGPSYAKILENTLPGAKKGWESMGLVEGRDFWIGRMPPAKLNVPKPIIGPLAPEHCIFWKNGAVQSLVSQDRKNSANGKTVHYVVGDEGKLLNKPDLDSSVLMTNRGDERYFGGIPEFHSTLFVSDMPTDKKGAWMLDAEKHMDRQRIEVIWAIRLKMYQLEQQFLVAAESRKAGILTEYKHWQKEWNALRGNAVYFSEASTLENIEGYGAKNLNKAKRDLPDFIYQTAILNKRPFSSDNTFYPDLTDAHFYDNWDYSYIDSLQLGTPFTDCRRDGDCDKDSPLFISFDYGAKINTCTTGQLEDNTLRVINAPYVKLPGRLTDLLEQWTTYYAYHRDKFVYFIYDHTALGTDAVRKLSYYETVRQHLYNHGWSVQTIYLGHTPSYQYRFDLAGYVMKAAPGYFDVAINRNNCEYLKISLQQTNLKARSQRAKGEDFEKDKGDERDNNIDQRETTHFSDAFDNLLCGVQKYLSSGGGTSAGTGVITTG